jgi:hypothetical protein
LVGLATVRAIVDETLQSFASALKLGLLHYWLPELLSRLLLPRLSPSLPTFLLDGGTTLVAAATIG